MPASYARCQPSLMLMPFSLSRLTLMLSPCRHIIDTLS
jgi:hypothetical protein